MRITLYGDRLDVERQGRKFRNESAWWYALKNELNAQGHDLIKKLMWKDGHMYGDEHTYYLRHRTQGYCFYDPEYAVRLVHEPEKVTLFRHVMGA
jgi:hypothetical protein